MVDGLVCWWLFECWSSCVWVTLPSSLNEYRVSKDDIPTIEGSASYMQYAVGCMHGCIPCYCLDGLVHAVLMLGNMRDYFCEAIASVHDGILHGAYVMGYCTMYAQLLPGA